MLEPFLRKPVTQHHLKLLVDYCVQAKLAAQKLNTLPKASAITTIDAGLRGHSADDDIVALGRLEDRIIVTGDFRTMNEHFYPPCTHGGILLIREEPTADKVYKLVRSFMLSGQRMKAAHCVTHLWSDRCRINTHSGVEEHRYGQLKNRRKTKGKQNKKRDHRRM